jgi:hypothetical protein
MALLALAGCSGDPEPAPTLAQPYSASVTIPDVPAGEEATKCAIVRLDLPAEGWVHRMRGNLGEGSHHLIAYASNAKAEQPDPAWCIGFTGVFQGERPLFIVQQRETELSLPLDDDGQVAFALEPDQLIRLEMHYINTSEAARSVTGSVTFDMVEQGTDVVRADFAFWGTSELNGGGNPPSEDIPAMSQADSGVVFQQALPGTKSFAATTHQHRLGTRMRLWHTNDPTALGEPVVDNSDWSDPPLVAFNPPLEHGADMGFAYRCEWNNPDNVSVSFGEGYYDEMCFLWHYYYPGQGFHLCTDFLCHTP